MNGREVFKFATRVMVSSAEALLDEVGRTIDDVDVYVPHQANTRIIDYAARKLGIAEDRVIVNVDRYGTRPPGRFRWRSATRKRTGGSGKARSS